MADLLGTGLGRPDDGLGARVSRFTFRHRLLAIGLLGVLMAGIIAQSVLAGLGHVRRSDEAVSLISHAQRLQQDADMMHDALRADVYIAVHVGPGGTPEARTKIKGATTLHDATLRRDLTDIASLHLTGPAATSLARLPKQLEVYAQAAVSLVDTALAEPVTTADLLGFERSFDRLVRTQADVTGQLEVDALGTQRGAEDAAADAQRQILLASTVALAVLLFLAGMLSRMGARLVQLVARQRGMAETLQQSLLPDRLPDLHGLSLAARYVPSGTGVEVGGDWYDVITLPNGIVGLVMGDVVGHDLRAASVMGQLRNALRAYALEGLSPALALGRLNHFVRQTDPGEMATCVFGLFDPQASTLLISNAGHYPPLIVGPDRQPTFLDYGECPPVGGLDKTVYTETLFHVQPGSTVLLYTDGLIERRDEDIQSGMARLRASATDGPADVDELCEHLLASLLVSRAPADDVAVLALSAQPKLGDEIRLNVRAIPAELGPMRHTITRWLQEAQATPDEVFELTVATCEAASNAIEHAYGPDGAVFEVAAAIHGRSVDIRVTDAGRWRLARGMDRGRGFTVIGEFTDTVSVDTTDSGTTVRMRRELAAVRAPEPLHTTGAG